MLLLAEGHRLQSVHRVQCSASGSGSGQRAPGKLHGNLLALGVCCVVGFIATQIPVYFFLMPILGFSLVCLGLTASHACPGFF